MNSLPINELKSQTYRLVGSLEDALNEVFEYNGKALPNRVKKYVFSIQTHANTLRKLLSDDTSSHSDLEAELSTIGQRASELEIALVKSEVDEAAVSKFNGLLQLIRGSGLSAVSTAQAKDLNLSTAATIAWQKVFREIDVSISKARTDIDEISIKQAQLRKRHQYADKKIEETAASVDALTKNLDGSLAAAKISVEDVLKDLKEKQEEVNNLVGLITGTAVAGSYGKSAESERRWADATRNGSVFLMLVVITIVGYSFLETGTPHFEWQTSLFRLLFSLALSVPAAYLTRESSKHRAQQYTYMRMSLDLQSITPYLASLPDSEQHRLKAEMAVRLFGGKEGNISTQESYPLNIQELVMALINRAAEPLGKATSAKEDKTA